MIALIDHRKEVIYIHFQEKQTENDLPLEHKRTNYQTVKLCLKAES
jgi:hypothetical protein